MDSANGPCFGAGRLLYDTSMTDSGPFWANVPNLPPTSPIRSMEPGDEPKPHQVTQRLTECGIDPDSAGAIIAAIFAKGWTFWLAGGPNGN
jgi:hypothetical protein